MNLAALIISIVSLAVSVVCLLFSRHYCLRAEASARRTVAVVSRVDPDFMASLTPSERRRYATR